MPGEIRSLFAYAAAGGTESEDGASFYKDVETRTITLRPGSSANSLYRLR